MAAGRREERRALSLDVWRLFVDKRFDAERYLRTGAIETWRPPPLPQTEMMMQAHGAAMEAKRSGKPWDITAWVRAAERNRPRKNAENTEKSNQ